MNVFEALLVAKQDINIMLLTDPGDGITTSVNDMGMMHGFNVTPEFSAFYFIFHLLNMVKECLLGFLTVTNGQSTSLSVAQKGELSPQHHNMVT